MSWIESLSTCRATKTQLASSAYDLHILVLTFAKLNCMGVRARTVK